MTVSRLVLRALLIGVLVGCPALFSASSLSERSCEALARWAERYRGTSPSLDDLARFDRAHKIAIFNAVSPAIRAALWQEHLRRFSRQADLSDAQRALIAEAVTLTTPALYARQPDAAKTFEELRPRIDRAFLGELRRAWFDLGWSTAGLSDAPTRSAWDRLVRPFTATAQYPFCECNFLQDDCYWGGHCRIGGCNEVLWGCGDGGAAGCDGLCR